MSSLKKDDESGINQYYHNKTINKGLTVPRRGASNAEGPRKPQRPQSGLVWSKTTSSGRGRAQRYAWSAYSRGGRSGTPPGPGQPPQVGSLSPAQVQALNQRTLQLFGPLPAARDLKGVRPDGSVDQMMLRNVMESIQKMKKSIEPRAYRLYLYGREERFC